MKIITEKFEPWAGAVATYNTIMEANKVDEFESLIDELYPEGIEEGKLNDILWFEDDWVLEMLGLSEEDEDEEEDY